MTSLIDELLYLRRYLIVAHHLPGRIRIRLSPAVLSEPRAKTLAASQGLRGALGALRGVRSVRANAKALSTTIEYETAVVSTSQLHELFTSRDPARVRALMEGILQNVGLSSTATEGVAP